MGGVNPIILFMYEVIETKKKKCCSQKYILEIEDNWKIDNIDCIRGNLSNLTTKYWDDLFY